MTQAASGYDRMAGDAYYTPAWVTEALLSVEHFRGEVFDPGAGEGHILEVCRLRGAEVRGMDIFKSEATPWYVEQGDFLAAVGSADSIIANPPYGTGGRTAVEFIKKSLAATEPRRGKVAMLLRVDFDSANGRRPIFNDHPAFAAKYTLTRRIRWANLEQKGSGPTENHCWMVWDWGKRRDAARAYGYLP
jgi:hypothetical protein